MFGSYFAGKIVSTGGMWVHNVVSAMLAFELSGSAFIVGLISVAQFGPQLLASPASGALVDRGDRKVQAVVGRLFATGGSALLALWLTLATPGALTAWPIVAASFIVGLGHVLIVPAQNAFLPSLVRRNELALAIDFNSVPPTLARAAGPIAGAWVAANLGYAVAFALAAVLNLSFAIVLARLPISTPKPTTASGGGVRAGLAYIRTNRGLTITLVGVMAVGLGSDPVLTLSPALSHHLGRGPALVGPLVTAFGVGAAGAFVVTSPIRKRLGLEWSATAGLTLLTSGLGAAAVAPGAVPALLAFGCAGSGMTLALTNLTTHLQLQLDEAFRGRVMAIWAMTFLGSRPLAAAWNGALSDWSSPRVALSVAAATVGLLGWLARPRSHDRNSVGHSTLRSPEEKSPD